MANYDYTNAIPSTWMPSGSDRADGTTSPIGLLPGTATPATAVRIDANVAEGSPYTIPFEEMPDSPEWERAEQATCVHRFTMSWKEALWTLGFLSRGTLLRDSYGDITKIVSSKIQHQKGGSAILTVIAEAANFDPPPDEFQIVPVELGIHIIKHPRYFYAFLGDGYGSATELKNQMVIRLLQDYMDNTSAIYRDAILKMLNASLNYEDGSPSAETGQNTQPPVGRRSSSTIEGVFDVGALVAGTKMAKYAAMEIITKYWRGTETPYIAGYQITWSQYYWRPQFLHPGGVVENPISEASPQLPEYFWDASGPGGIWIDPATGDGSIFARLASLNPQCFSVNGKRGGDVNISWLRKADQIDYQRTWFKVTRTWIGSPFGFWDEDIFSAGNRPQADSAAPFGYRVAATVLSA